jgi:WD40 repeat protein
MTGYLQCLMAFVSFTLWFGEGAPERKGLAARQPYSIKAHDTAIAGLAFSSDGKYLVSAGRDHCLKMWLIEENRLGLLCTTETECICYELSCNHDGSAIAVHAPSRRSIQFFVRVDGKLQKAARSIAHEEAGRGYKQPVFAFSPAGNWAAYSSIRDASLEWWKFPVTEKGPTLRVKTKSWALEAVRFSPDGSKLCAAGVDDKAYLLAIKEKEERLILIDTLKLDIERDSIFDLVVSNDAFQLAVACGTHWRYRLTAQVRDLRAGKSRTLRIPARGDGAKYNAASFVQEMSRLAVGDGAGFLETWDIERGEKVHAYNCKSACYAVASNSVSGYVAAGCWDGTIHLVPIR